MAGTSRSAVLGACIVAGWLGGTDVTLAKDPTPAHARGLTPSGAVLLDGDDAVNLSNANVVIRVPVAPSYPQVGNLSLSLTAVYNLNFWRFAHESFQSQSLNVRVEYGFVTSGGDLGPGWVLRPFGRLLETTPGIRVGPRPPLLLFEDASGSIQKFRAMTGSETPSLTLPPSPPGYGPNFVSLDGSFRLLRQQNPPSGPWEMVHPDGTIVTFAHRVGVLWNKTAWSEPWESDGIETMAAEKSPSGGWYPTLVRDVFGNQISLCYHDELPGGAHLLKRITDSAGRQITFGASTTPVGTMPVSRSYAIAVYTGVEYPTFGGDRVTSDFVYRDADLVSPLGDPTCWQVGATWHRGASLGPSSVTCESGMGSCFTPVTCTPAPAYECGEPYRTAVLERIDIPVDAGVTYGYEFTSNASGEIYSWRNPRGARYDYTLDWLGYRLTRLVCGDNGFNRDWCENRLGATYVRDISERHITLGSAVQTWTYDQGGPPQAPCHTGSPTQMIVGDPEGHDTVYLYWNSAQLEAEREWNELPLENPASCDASDGGNCNCAPGAKPDEMLPCLDSEDSFPGSWAEGLLCRTIRYEHGVGSKVLQVEDLQWAQSLPGDDVDGARWPRIVGKKLSHPGENQLHLVQYRDYDSVGHFRDELHWDAIGPTLPLRRVHTQWNPATGNWILERFDSKSVFDHTNAEVSRETFDFNAANGLLQSVQSYCRWTGSPDDAEFCNSTFGNAIDHQFQYFGNGEMRLETWSRPGSQTFQVDYTHNSGSLETETMGGLKLLDRTIDSATGLAASERESSGIETDYDYDYLGRETWRQRAEVEEAVHTTFPSAREWRQEQGTGNGRRMTYGRLDGLGRHVEERTLNAEGFEVARFTTYDGLGQLIAQTEWGSSTDKSTFAYDALGREIRRTTADGGLTTSLYRGLRHKTATVHGIAGQRSIATFDYTFDIFGNLVAVTEPPVTGGRPTTTYLYDALDRLLSVVQSHDSNIRSRTFAHDSLGGLRRATEPENGITRHTKYDARGHLLKRLDANGVESNWTFDAAERLRSVVMNTGDPATLVQQSFEYDNASGSCAAFDTGNLTRRSATRDSETVEERFCFESAGRARPTSTSTTVAGEVFRSDFTYDLMGGVATVGYPYQGMPRRTVSFTTEHGFTRVIADTSRTYVSEVKSNPGGLHSHWEYGNGVTADFSPDRMNRPRTIRYDRAGISVWPQWNLGYDGAGNLSSIDWRPLGSYPRTDTFRYDLLSRLVTIGISDQEGREQEGSMDFDGFGNITRYVQGGINLLPQGTTYPSNRMTFLASQYDDAGNMKRDGLFEYRWDAANRMRDLWRVGSLVEAYVYDASGYRALRTRQGRKRFFLRDSAGRVLSEFESGPGCGQAVTWVKDYIYLGDKLAATVDSGIDGVSEVKAFGLDGGAMVLWPVVPGATGYIVRRDVDAAMSNPTTIYAGACQAPPCELILHEGLGEFLTLPDSGLGNGTTYYYWVSSLLDCFEADPTGPAAALPQSAPAPPASVTVARNRSVTLAPMTVEPRNTGWLRVDSSITSDPVEHGGLTISYTGGGAGTYDQPVVQVHVEGATASDVATTPIQKASLLAEHAVSHYRWAESGEGPVSARCRAQLHAQNTSGNPISVTPVVRDSDQIIEMALETRILDPGCGETWDIYYPELDQILAPFEECRRGSLYLFHSGTEPEDVRATLLAYDDWVIPPAIFQMELEPIGPGMDGVVYSSALRTDLDNVTEVTVRNNAHVPLIVGGVAYIDGAPGETIAPTLYVSWPASPALGVTGYRVYRRLWTTSDWGDPITWLPVAGQWYGDDHLPLSQAYDTDYEYTVAATLNYFNEGPKANLTSHDLLPSDLAGSSVVRIPRFATSDSSDTKIRLRNTGAAETTCSSGTGERWAWSTRRAA